MAEEKAPADQMGAVHYPDKNVMFLCFDGWDGEVPRGRILNAYCPDELSFVGLDQMLLKVDWFCDQLRVAQGYVERRQVGLGKTREVREWNQKQVWEAAQSLEQFWFKFGDALVVPVRILFRMNATWQGQVLISPISKSPISFRSALELLGLLDGALRKKKTKYKLGSQRKREKLA